jgi:hypothetical protein
MLQRCFRRPGSHNLNGGLRPIALRPWFSPGLPLSNMLCEGTVALHALASIALAYTACGGVLPGIIVTDGVEIVHKEYIKNRLIHPVFYVIHDF